jgi:hypothetical protein
VLLLLLWQSGLGQLSDLGPGMQAKAAYECILRVNAEARAEEKTQVLMGIQLGLLVTPRLC